MTRTAARLALMTLKKACGGMLSVFLFFLFLPSKKKKKGSESVAAVADPLTPHQQVGRGLVDAPGVAGHAGVGAGVGDVRRRDEKAAGLQQGKARQLH